MHIFSLAGTGETVQLRGGRVGIFFGVLRVGTGEQVSPNAGHRRHYMMRLDPALERYSTHQGDGAPIGTER